MIYGYINNNVFLNQLSAEDIGQCDQVYTFERINSVGSLKLSFQEDELLSKVVSGDTVITGTLMNFGYTLTAALATLLPVINSGVRIISYSEDFDSALMADSLNQLFPVIESFERNRRRHTLNRNKKKESVPDDGFIDGRKISRLSYNSFPDFKDKYNLYKSGGKQKKDIAKEWQISRPTLDRLFKDYEEEINN